MASLSIANIFAKSVFNVLAPNFCPAHPHHNPYTTVYGTLAFVFRPLRNAVLKAAALHLHHSGQLTLDLSTRFHDHATASAKGAESTALQGVPKAATIMLSILCEVSHLSPHALTVLTGASLDHRIELEGLDLKIDTSSRAFGWVELP